MDDIENRLLQAAGEVFAEKGFRQATIREIVRQAGVKNIAAVNYYFGDKEKLYQATLNHAFCCKFSQIPVPNWDARTPSAQKLRDTIRAIVERMVVLEQPWQLQVLMRELTAPSQAGANLVRDYIRPIYEFLWVVLRDVLPGPVSEEKLHLIAFSIVGQCFYHKVARPIIQLVVGLEEFARYDVELLTDHIASFTLAALGVKAGQGDTVKG